MHWPGKISAVSLNVKNKVAKNGIKFLWELNKEIIQNV